MSGEVVGAEEEPYSLKLLLNCILMVTYGGTDMTLMALAQSQMYCSPVTGTTRWLFLDFVKPFP